MKKKKRLGKFSALIFAIIIVMSMVLSGCASDSSAVSEARYGTVRIMTFFSVYCVEDDYEMGEAGYIGSAFGIGEAGEPTDIFVTAQHVVSLEDESWTYREYFEEVTDNPDAAVEYFEENGIDVDENYVTIQYTLTSVYILLNDYSYTSADGIDLSRSVPCSVIYAAGDGEADIAILQAAEVVEDRVALAIMDSDDLEVGDTVYAIGYPKSADLLWVSESGSYEYEASIDKATVTSGVVSTISYSTADGYEMITNTAILNGGNSGGPLVTEDGVVVGVNVLSYSDYYGAVSSGELIKILDSEGIEYELYSGIDLTMIIIIAAAAVVVIAVIIILIIIFIKKKKNKNVPEPQPEPQPEPVQTSSFGETAQADPASGPYIENDSGLRIQAETGVFAGRRFAITGELRIGRDPSRNDLVYPAETKGISGVHCKLVARNGQLILVDLGSTYGTFLQGGQRLAANQAIDIHPGERFYLASRDEQFVVVRSGE